MGRFRAPERRVLTRGDESHCHLSRDDAPPRPAPCTTYLLGSHLFLDRERRSRTDTGRREPAARRRGDAGERAGRGP